MRVCVCVNVYARRWLWYLVTSCIVDRLLEMSTVLTKRNFRSRIEDIGWPFSWIPKPGGLMRFCQAASWWNFTYTMGRPRLSKPVRLGPACHKSNPLAANGNSKASRAEAKFSHMSSEETKKWRNTMKYNCIVFRPSCDMRVCRYICVCDCLCWY